MNINIISQYKGLRRENYILCFGRLVTAMGAMVRPMLTMILSQKLGMNAVQVAWVTALMGILSIPANLVGGKMADRFSKKMNIEKVTRKYSRGSNKGWQYIKSSSKR